MADTPPPFSSEPATPPSSAAEQARIRKERREAKIRAGGSARLNKITGLGGGIQRDPPPPAVSQPQSNDATDPEEVDISQHFYQPATTARARLPQLQQEQPPSQPPADGQLSDDQLRAMMLGFPSAARGPPQPPPGPAPNPFAGLPGMEGLSGSPEDPMLKLLQQMMGGMGGGAGGMPAGPMGMPGQQAAVGGDSYAYVWRIVHAVFALGLGLYVAVAANFTGTKLERQMGGLKGAAAAAGGEGMAEGTVQFFYIFATVEVVLQTARFYVEKGTVQTGGALGMVLGLVPQPWKGYLAIVMRYARIWTTTTTDALVCVFVLGVCSWLRAAQTVDVSHVEL